MIRAARLEAIESMVAAHHVVSTQQIAAELAVSGTTARRDLEDLVAAGRVERVHGGARSLSAPPAAAPESERPSAGPADGEDEHTDIDDPFHEVLRRNSAVKKALAEVAAEEFTDGQTLYLDIGTTTYELARRLMHLDLTVVTSSLEVVQLLSAAPQVKVVVLGGEYNREYRCTQGPRVLEGLKDLHIDCAVLGCAGITETGVVRDTDSRQASIKRAAAAASSRTVLLADASKIPGVGAYTALDISEVDRLVTEGPLPTALHDLCTAADTEVLTA
jgi:DeoR/GlpR family transcriptional regulator of sugar metabolism